MCVCVCVYERVCVCVCVCVGVTYKSATEDFLCQMSAIVHFDHQPTFLKGRCLERGEVRIWYTVQYSQSQGLNRDLGSSKTLGIFADVSGLHLSMEGGVHR